MKVIFFKYSASPEAGIKLHCLKLQVFLLAKFQDSLGEESVVCLFQWGS